MSERTIFLADLKRAVGDARGGDLWARLEDWAGHGEAGTRFRAAFPDLAALGGLDRRSILKLLGASLAAGTLAACDSPAAPLLSRSRGAADPPAGLPRFFATSLARDGLGIGLLARNNDGWATKIEGNPDHPASLGASDAVAQAEIFGLYDPDRSRTPLMEGQAVAWPDVDIMLAEMREELGARGGEGLRILTPPVSSPLLLAAFAELERLYPGMRRHVLHAHGRGTPEGSFRAFGRALSPVHNLGAARTVLSVWGDPLAEGPAHLRERHDFMEARRRGIEAGDPPRLYALEATPSLTGTRADRRIVCRPAEIEPFLRIVAGALNVPGLAAAGESSDDAAMIAGALAEAGPDGLVMVGPNASAGLHALGHAINETLGARAVRHIDPPAPDAGTLAELMDEMEAGTVRQLLVLGANPAYDAPGFETLLETVPSVVHLGTHVDETASRVAWHVPERHGLEAWGDMRAFDGTASIAQPVMRPLAEARTATGLLAPLMGVEAEERDFVRAYWRREWGLADAAFEERWRAALDRGTIEDSAFAPVGASLAEDWDAGPAETSAGGLAIVFTAGLQGSTANNPWLQEAPHPLTRTVWGNQALIAEQTAERLGLGDGDIVALDNGGRSLEAPVKILRGQAPDTLALARGYGRRAAGRFGDHVGFDANRLRRGDEGWTAGIALEPTGRNVRLVATQPHTDMADRDIVRSVTPDDLAAGPSSVTGPSLYPEREDAAHAWGMAIDLDACIGCNACLVACQAENNVPAVGPVEVARGREMHWLRIDLYHEDDATHFQPVPCMHCETAPCEPVCPVHATVHSSEGLNDMVYARCIGTRACANNCPYKVRRFNWHAYSTGDFATPREALNPHVAVRSRGVMEKCTFCVQRIAAARIRAGIEERGIEDGEIVTACQQACASRAITFGDLNDPDSAVSRAKASPRDYALLGELNTRPRATYLARVARADGGPGEEPEGR